MSQSQESPAMTDSTFPGATPRPWRVLPRCSNGCEECPEIWAGDHWVATVVGAPYLGNKDTHPNAALIVEAVNAYDGSLKCPKCNDGHAGTDHTGEAMECHYCGGSGHLTADTIIKAVDSADGVIGDAMACDALGRELDSTTKELDALRTERDALKDEVQRLREAGEAAKEWLECIVPAIGATWLLEYYDTTYGKEVREALANLTSALK